ncbi:MAG TPA: DUF2971 domain-containing protein [Verrucomicrobiae bacterium]|nr:DUF2971 domain-containing protein [Verrucomicrobiae bacterium]
MRNKEKSSVPEVVYHYTSMNALLGIVEGDIWATNILYLNDISEYSHFINLVRSRLPHFARSHSFRYPDLIPRLIARRTRRSHSYMDVPFVASFSQDRDSLTHWRSYCPQGNGVCIGFRSASLRSAYLEKAEPQMCLAGFCAVNYLRPDDLKSLDLMISEAIADSERLVAAMEPGQGTIASVANRVGSMRAQFEFRSGMIKHESFKDEREYRLIVSLFDHGDLVSHRPSRTTLVPYLKMRLTDPAQVKSASLRVRSAMDRFIESVTIGPTPHPGLSADAVLGLLRSKGFGARVEASSVPFRDW